MTLSFRWVMTEVLATLLNCSCKLVTPLIRAPKIVTLMVGILLEAEWCAEGTVVIWSIFFRC